jgi:valyl-tRNA synthetase
VPEACGECIDVHLADRWIFSRLNNCADLVNRAIEQYRFHEAAQLLWHFFWHEFCDWYVEIKKLQFRENSGADAHWRNLLTVFDTALRMLHPFMPFLTEELWQRLGGAASPGCPISIALTRYPQYHSQAADLSAEHEMRVLQDMITAARTLRADMKLDPKQELGGVLYCRAQALEVAKQHIAIIQKLAKVNLELHAEAPPPLTGSARSTPDFDLLLRVTGAQADAMRQRLEKEIQQLEKVIASSHRQLGNEQFLAGAPPHVIDSIRTKLAGYEAQLEKSRAALRSK